MLYIFNIVLISAYICIAWQVDLVNSWVISISIHRKKIWLTETAKLFYIFYGVWLIWKPACIYIYSFFSNKQAFLYCHFNILKLYSKRECEKRFSFKLFYPSFWRFGDFLCFWKWSWAQLVAMVTHWIAPLIILSGWSYWATVQW